MERERSRIFEEFCPHAESGLAEYIEAFLEAETAVEKYEVRESQEKMILIHAVLVKFTFVTARSVFLGLSELVRRSLFNVYASEELDERVRYLFITGRSGMDGIKIEMIID